MLRLLRLLLLGVVLVSACAAGGFYWLVSKPLPLADERIEFSVTPGSGMRAAARDVVAAGVPFEPLALVVLGRLLRVDASIKAGSYEITRGESLLDLLKKLTRGDVTLSEIVFPEGWTFRQIRERLDAHPDVTHASTGLSDMEIMRLIGADGESLEGWIFPDTYLFAKNSRDIEVLARAHHAMQRHLAQAWESRAPGLPLATPYQALVLASIVEKETGREQDRPLVAAVFINRLKRGMLLQTDPSVIYGLGQGFDGNLRKRDLLADTPYNTYTRAGLPPTPIAMPGLASIKAVLHPAESSALYFVARGDGSSHFSQTLDEHNNAVNRFQRKSR
ncbi:endolytic transglycosylase MltG [Propionivibrio sp.]|uniref:endolytic transglycosylase MltG n=1 Tax=Propionivibrio sp. TaxID=2212460 RepID=UPI00272E0F3B|nr:endolytic transglycosylase MltG [Propionivibrio sp.]